MKILPNLHHFFSFYFKYLVMPPLSSTGYIFCNNRVFPYIITVLLSYLRKLTILIVSNIPSIFTVSCLSQQCLLWLVILSHVCHCIWLQTRKKILERPLSFYMYFFYFCSIITFVQKSLFAKEQELAQKAYLDSTYPWFWEESTKMAVWIWCHYLPSGGL